MSDEPAMTSQRPYLLRALWEWIQDNGLTPHLLVDATAPGVRVPPHTIVDGKVVLNIADRAVGNLHIGDDEVVFDARFGGVRHAVIVPIAAVLAIYARENGRGMGMPDDVDDASDTADASGDPGPDGSDDEPAPPPPPRGGHLRVVK